MSAAEPVKNNLSASLCRCVCGDEKIVANHHLRKGVVRSCGCLYAKNTTKSYVAKRKTAVELRQKRLSLQEIGKRMGLTYQRVQQILESAGASGYIGLGRGELSEKELRPMVQDSFLSDSAIARLKNISQPTVTLRRLKYGITQPTSRERLRRTYVGKTYALLTVIDVKRENSEYMALCRCKCGKQKWMQLGNVKMGKSKSCGCLSEVWRKISDKTNPDRRQQFREHVEKILDGDDEHAVETK